MGNEVEIKTVIIFLIAMQVHKSHKVNEFLSPFVIQIICDLEYWENLVSKLWIQLNQFLDVLSIVDVVFRKIKAKVSSFILLWVLPEVCVKGHQHWNLVGLIVIKNKPIVLEQKWVAFLAIRYKNLLVFLYVPDGSHEESIPIWVKIVLCLQIFLGVIEHVWERYDS